MANYNKLTIIGHLGRDPETKATSSGAILVKFPVAVTEYTKKKVGEGFDEKTTWFDCTCWDNYLANKISRSGIQKGNAVMIVGAVSASAYAGEGGVPKASLQVNVKELVNLTAKAAANNAQQPQASNNPYSYKNQQTNLGTPQQAPAQTAEDYNPDDDLPF